MTGPSVAASSGTGGTAGGGSGRIDVGASVSSSASVDAGYVGYVTHVGKLMCMYKRVLMP
eukprot:3248131-Amphidinium_carterae.3